MVGRTATGSRPAVIRAPSPGAGAGRSAGGTRRPVAAPASTVVTTRVPSTCSVCPSGWFVMGWRNISPRRNTVSSRPGAGARPPRPRPDAVPRHCGHLRPRPSGRRPRAPRPPSGRSRPGPAARPPAPAPAAQAGPTRRSRRRPRAPLPAPVSFVSRGQNATDGRWTPKTARSRVPISPRVTSARTASSSRGQEVVGPARRRSTASSARAARSGPAPPEVGEPLGLGGLHRRIGLEERGRRRGLGDELVDADDDARAASRPPAGSGRPRPGSPAA